MKVDLPKKMKKANSPTGKISMCRLEFKSKCNFFCCAILSISLKHAEVQAASKGSVLGMARTALWYRVSKQHAGQD